MSCHVLFVDDEPENLVVFEAACADRFAVLTAGSAHEALELMHSHEVAVLIADQRMPGATGLELLERARTEHPRCVRMLVTAYSDLATAIDAINRGRVRRYLCKPWDPDELCAALTEGIDFYQMSMKLCALERRLRETERVYALGVITAGLARELRKPVGTMRSSLSRVRDQVRQVASAISTEGNGPLLSARLLEVDEELGEAHVCAERVLDVVRGIEIPTGQSVDQTSDPSEVLRLSLRLLQSEIRASTSLELDVKPTPHVAGSVALLGQVVINLLVNALHSVSSEPRAKRMLLIRLGHEPPWVRLEIADTGPGIAPELLDRMFDPFLITGRSSTAGLGLAISKSIVEAIGGQIEVENRARGGTLFRVRLRAIG
jgi:two-component system NtrC family sensor kinase